MDQKSNINCILLVDDDKINNFINLKLLQKLRVGKQHKTALNGKEGLKYINEFCLLETKCCPELIFLDINMPVMNGLEFLKAYGHINFQNKSNVRIVVLTTSTNANDMEKIKELGITDFINKPLTEEKLKTILMADKII